MIKSGSDCDFSRLNEQLLDRNEKHPFYTSVSQARIFPKITKRLYSVICQYYHCELHMRHARMETGIATVTKDLSVNEEGRMTKLNSFLRETQDQMKYTSDPGF